MDRAPTNVMSGSLGIFDDPDAFIGSQVFSDPVPGPMLGDLYPTPGNSFVDVETREIVCIPEEAA